MAFEVLLAGGFSCSLIPAANATGKAINHLFLQRQQAGGFFLLSSGPGRQRSAPGLDWDRVGAASLVPGKGPFPGTQRAALSQPEAFKPRGEIMSWTRPCLECQEDAFIPEFRADLCRAGPFGFKGFSLMRSP